MEAFLLGTSNFYLVAQYWLQPVPELALQIAKGINEVYFKTLGCGPHLITSEIKSSLGWHQSTISTISRIIKKFVQPYENNQEKLWDLIIAVY